MLTPLYFTVSSFFVLLVWFGLFAQLAVSVLHYSDGTTFSGSFPLSILWLDRIRLDPTLRSGCYWLQ